MSSLTRCISSAFMYWILWKVRHAFSVVMTSCWGKVQLRDLSSMKSRRQCWKTYIYQQDDDVVGLKEYFVRGGKDKAGCSQKLWPTDETLCRDSQAGIKPGPSGGSDAPPLQRSSQVISAKTTSKHHTATCSELGRADVMRAFVNLISLSPFCHYNSSYPPHLATSLLQPLLSTSSHHALRT